MLVRRPFLTAFFGLRKVRFECYCTYFQFNQIVFVLKPLYLAKVQEDYFVLKLLPMIFYIIVKTLVLLHFVVASIWGIETLVRKLYFTVFSGLLKVRFQCYCSVQVQSYCSQTISNNLICHC